MTTRQEVIQYAKQIIDQAKTILETADLNEREKLELAGYRGPEAEVGLPEDVKEIRRQAVELRKSAYDAKTNKDDIKKAEDARRDIPPQLKEVERLVRKAEGRS